MIDIKLLVGFTLGMMGYLFSFLTGYLIGKHRGK